MAATYSEFDTTPAGVVAAVKAAILASSDYSNPTGQVVQATAASGATIALDLVGGGAADNQRLRTKAWRVFSAGSGTDGYQRTLYWCASGNNAAAPLHCKVAASTTLLYIEIEGPRGGETAADNVTWGSQRQNVFIADVTPYMAADVTPCVVYGGSTSTQGTETANGTAGVADVVHVSRNQAGTGSWLQGRLLTMSKPSIGGTTSSLLSYTNYASDGTTILFPYVLVEDVAGLRGRLTDLYFAGMFGSANQDNLTVIGTGQDVTYSGKTYRTTACYKSDSGRNCLGSLGVCNTSSGAGQQNNSPIIAVRKA